MLSDSLAMTTRMCWVHRFLLPLVLLASLGCAHPVFHSSGAKSYPPKQPDCPVRVLGALPASGYEELGTLSIEGDRSFGAGEYSNSESFLKDVRPQVCATGGDVLVTEVNGSGYIARGIVLRETAAGPAPAPAPPDAGACTPICSPGFACTAGKCIPLCNPACAANETCGNDRLCHRSAT
jgi:hypothetical protein